MLHLDEVYPGRETSDIESSTCLQKNQHAPFRWGVRTRADKLVIQCLVPVSTKTNMLLLDEVYPGRETSDIESSACVHKN